MSNTPPKSTKLENLKEYKQLNQFLDTANNRTKENDSKRKAYQTNVNLFTSGLMKKLRATDKLFDKMYSTNIMAGNYFDCPNDLNYDEYNISIILKVPLAGEAATNSVTVMPTKKRGYCRLQINSKTMALHENDPMVKDFRDKFVHKENFLRVNSLCEWFEQIFNESFTSPGKNLIFELEIARKNMDSVLFSISKPKKTETGLFVKVDMPKDKTQFSIDISLGMEFDRKCSQYNGKIPMSSVNEKWVAIAKPDKKDISNDLDWLCSFYGIERKMLQDTNKSVPLIRIFKQFFNVAIKPNLSTYLIENLFLEEIVKQQKANRTDFWQSSLASIFIYMLDQILQSLNKNSIPYYWDSTVNLADQINSKKIHDKFAQHKKLLDIQIRANDTEAYFDDLFFKIGNNLSLDIANGSNINESTSTTSTIYSQFLSIFYKSDKKNTPSASNGFSNASSSTASGPIISRSVSTQSVPKPKEPLVSRSISTITGPPSSNYDDSSNDSQASHFFSKASTTGSTTSSVNGDRNRKGNRSVNATLILQLLSNFIKVKDRQQYTDHYNVVLNYFVDELKKSDEIFPKIYRGHVMGGSYTDGLKVSKPNEFDTLLRFNFSVDKTKITVQKCKERPAYCNINLKNCDLNNKSYLTKFLDTDGYVLQGEILKWLQRLFTAILQPHDQNNKIININGYSYQYAHSRHGPAFTFAIKVLTTNIEFDMDLVPAFPFDEKNWLSTRKLPDKNQIIWLAVPKPPKEGICKNNRSFICSYTELEKHFLHNANTAKNLIRLFKKLRDNHNLTSLKSYFIKTIFLWQVHAIPDVTNRKAYWSRPLDIVFLDMFKIILDHIKKRELLFFWDMSYNMFSTIQPTVLQSIDDRLRGIYSRTEANLKDNKNPEYLIDIILTKEEKPIFILEHEKKLSPD